MELRQLRYYEAVTRHRHFTRAAEELHVAQSALSQQVARLERELGIELLERTTRSVDTTDAGELVAARARTILGEADALYADVDALRGLTRGRVRIGALLFGGALDIPALLAEFIDRYPNVDVGLREGTVQRMLDMLMDGSLDLTFALEPPVLPDGVERLPVSSEELAVAASPSHRVASRARLRLNDLRDERLIMFEVGASTRERVDRAFAAVGVTPRIALEANDLAVVRALVARGIGLAIMPRSFADLAGPPVAVRPLAPTLRMPVALWWRAGRHLPPAARAFVEFTRGRALA